MLSQALSWYFFSPWRRLNRVQFSSALGLISLPALALMALGIESTAASFLSPLLNLSSQTNNPEALLATLNSLNQPAATPAAPSTLTTLTALTTTLAQLLFIPACRMRLVDMGRSHKIALPIALFINLSYANTLTATLGFSWLPAAWLFGIITFLGYLWLCLAPSAPKVAPYERQVPPPNLPR
ncbi:MAG: hypothetical protein EBR79_04230 [Proteobacteria bacterium]|nr:hypothetical protein [Pseudomonadota bacterium]NBX85817.1 hypothetical protein [Pseudomonadota bacterium]